MLLKPVKLLKMEQLVLLYYHLLPVEDVAIYTKIMLHWMGFSPKRGSSNCVWPQDFHKNLVKNLPQEIKSNHNFYENNTPARFLLIVKIVDTVFYSIFFNFHNYVTKRSTFTFETDFG